MLKFAILAILALPSICAALSRREIASALIAAEDTGTLEENFKTFKNEQNHDDLSGALVDVAKVQARMPIVVKCLRMTHNLFPKDTSRVSFLVDWPLYEISDRTWTESFTNMIVCFKPSDGKLLTTIRHRTLDRDDAVKILKSVMKKSPELITDDLPSWIAFHSLDRNSKFYRPVSEKAFQYLTSFATQSALEEALAIVKRNEHYQGNFGVYCCKPRNYFPQDLFDKLNVLLELVKARKALVNELAILPKVLVELVLDFVTMSDRSDSSFQCLIS